MIGGNMSEIMLILAENWKIGYGILNALVLIVYLIFSIRLVITSRRIGYDVGVSAMIPLINIIVFLKKGHKVRKIKKQQKNDSRLLGEEEEFEL